MRNLHPVKVGQCLLDGKHIYIQSMLNTRSDDIAGSVAQAKALEAAGCEILRAAIPNQDAVALIPAIKEAPSSWCFSVTVCAPPVPSTSPRRKAPDGS